ncbi:ferric reductase-like transmembrane domain-containing protein [Shimia abyssi]|uniref:Ferric reductase like protein n=1 Tax=Shimia abyssi TaxID=1662395 RepID=A0A2P8F6C4_9RHOB|nr:ferric reductase-like transmembrane domain-containing protein [Shimia abyssi]PSL17273.1 ferric reductase like protein [Shimia abyssi]
MTRGLRSLIWLAVLGAATLPVVIAAFSPYLAYRNPAYIVAGFAGILSLSLFLLQPLLAAGYLPGLRLPLARKLHRIIGAALLACLALHIGGLYLTSPPDTLDALLLVSPTPFSVYGVLATLGLIATILLVALRRRVRYGHWRLLHNALALFVVIATLIHALQIEGTMGPVSKWLLCGAVLIATATTLINERLLKPLRRN